MERKEEFVYTRMRQLGSKLIILQPYSTRCRRELELKSIFFVAISTIANNKNNIAREILKLSKKTKS